MNAKTQPMDASRRVVSPRDDGGARHLVGLILPAIKLTSTMGTPRDLSAFGSRVLLFVYPATGVPDRDPAIDPAPGWDDIPGASGCTAQCTSYRDELTRIRSHGFDIVGLSSQPSAEQTDFVARHGIPFPLLSDPSFLLADALRLPDFVVAQRRFYKRLTMVVVDNRIVHTFYPVFPPHDDANAVTRWLASWASPD
jgi:peroxiredoxin